MATMGSNSRYRIGPQRAGQRQAIDVRQSDGDSIVDAIKRWCFWLPRLARLCQCRKEKSP
jgi:hypothetical protein